MGTTEGGNNREWEQQRVGTTEGGNHESCHIQAKFKPKTRQARVETTEGGNNRRWEQQRVGTTESGNNREWEQQRVETTKVVISRLSLSQNPGKQGWKPRIQKEAGGVTSCLTTTEVRCVSQ